MFFVISVDPPIKQGQTRYPFVICLFDKDSLQDITLDMPEDELNEKYSGKLTRNMTGATFEVVSRLMKAVTGRKITVPGSYKSDQGMRIFKNDEFEKFGSKLKNVPIFVM